MNESNKKNTVPRPFLRKGAGLRRFYKDINIDEHFEKYMKSNEDGQLGINTQTNSDGVSCPVEEQPKVISKVPQHSLLKGIGSPKRNLNVRFHSPPSVNETIDEDQRTVNNRENSPNIKQRYSRKLDFNSIGYKAPSDQENQKFTIEDSSADSHSCKSEEEEDWTTDDEEDECDMNKCQSKRKEEEPDTDVYDTSDTDDDIIKINESSMDALFRSIVNKKSTDQPHPVFQDLKSALAEYYPEDSNNQVNLQSNMQNFNQLNSKDQFGTLQNPPMQSSHAVQAQIGTLKNQDYKHLQELEMFEKMEKLTSNHSFCSTASTVQRFVRRPLDISPVIFPQATGNEPEVEQNNYDGPSSQICKANGVNSGCSNLNPPNSSTPTTFQNFLEYRQPEASSSNNRSSSYHSTTLENDSIVKRREELRKDENYLQALLATKVVELETEMERFTIENKKVQQLREYLEREGNDLEQCKIEFEARKKKDSEIIDELKKRLKIDQEKLEKEILRQRKKNSTDAEVETELISLRNRTKELEKELEVRTSRWGSSARNFKKTIEGLRQENEKLKRDISEMKRNQLIRDRQRIRYARGKLTTPDEQKAGIDAEKCEPCKNNAEIPQQKNTSNPLQEVTGNKLNDVLSETKSEKYVVHQSPEVQTAGFKDSCPQLSPHLNKQNENVASEREEIDENGTVRIISNINDQCLEVRYPNGDIKDLRELMSEGITKYYFSSANSWEIINTRKGTEVFKFATGDIQTKYPNGIVETKYLETGITKRVLIDGTEEFFYPDKTIVRKLIDGDRELHLPNGQIEFQGKDLKIRIYPDGTEKVLYENGSCLTRYSTGRERFRDPTGNIIYDRTIRNVNS